MSRTKKSKRSKGRKSFPRETAPLQKSKKIKMRYCMNDVLAPGANSTDYVDIAANGLYDPEVAVGGHQPFGFDNYVGVFYDHYTVVGAKITVDAVSTTAVPTIVGIHLADTSGKYNGINNNYAREINNNTWKVMSNTQGGTDHIQVTKSYNAYKFHGQDVMAGSIFRGNDSANPAEDAVFSVWASGIAAASDPGNIEIAITVEYDVILTEPKQLTQS